MQDGIVTWAEIDLDAIAHNIRAFQQFVGPSVQVIAVVKANAYGHGAVPVARAALAAGATRLAVHRLLEAEELREAGLAAPILVMGYIPPSGADTVARLGVTPTVNTLEFAQALSACSAARKLQVPIHMKVDTGMGRYGVLPDEAVPFAQALLALPGLVLEGIYSHFATADSADPTFAREQIALFRGVLTRLGGAGIHIPFVHMANSAGTMQFPEAHFDAVRPGIAIYGLNPSDEWVPPFEIRPALTLKSTVSRVRDLPKGASVSYGRTYIAPHPIRAALVPVGYGDGYHRVLSNKGTVLIRGRRAPIIGRVCMDQFVVDATDIQVQQDDEVVIIGRQGDAEIRAEEVARLAGTINYEVTTGILPRVVRVYKSESRTGG